MDGIANQFPIKKCTILPNFAYTISHIFRGGIPQDLCSLQRRSVPLRIQTPISAGLASVSIAPVLRNDQCAPAVQGFCYSKISVIQLIGKEPKNVSMRLPCRTFYAKRLTLNREQKLCLSSLLLTVLILSTFSFIIPCDF